MTNNTTSQKKVKVLIVDDEEGIRYLLESNLFRYGFSVYTAANGKHGLQKLEATPDISLVISDLKMNGMDGCDFFKACREKHPHLKFLVMTGSPDKSKLVKMAHLGLNHVLIKPFRMEELMGKLDILLNEETVAKPKAVS